MKKIGITIVMSVIMLSTYTVNAQKAKYEKLSDVVVEKLETVCDCADAKAIQLKEELAAKKKGGFTDEEAKAWESKGSEISGHCMGKKGYSYAQFRECDSMKAVMKEMAAHMKAKKEKAAKTSDFDNNKAEVCHCFKSAKEKGEAPSDCYMMQSKYAKLQGDRKKEFIQTTNKCP